MSSRCGAHQGRAPLGGLVAECLQPLGLTGWPLARSGMRGVGAETGDRRGRRPRLHVRLLRGDEGGEQRGAEVVGESGREDDTVPNAAPEVLPVGAGVGHDVGPVLDDGDVGGGVAVRGGWRR